MFALDLASEGDQELAAGKKMKEEEKILKLVLRCDVQLQGGDVGQHFPADSNQIRGEQSNGLEGQEED